MRLPKILKTPAIRIGIAAIIAALCLAALASGTSRIEKTATIDAEQFADFINNEIFDIQDLAEGAEIQRRMFNRMTPPGFAWVQPMFPPVVPFDAENFDEQFLDELLGGDKNSVAIYLLTLALDPKTHETLVYNADGKLIAAIPADRVYREWPEDADPARVTLQLDLLPAEDIEPYLYTESRIAEYDEFQSAKSTKSGEMVLRSLSASEFGIAGIQLLTNGNMQITVTNGAVAAEVYSYTVWHTSTVTTNEWVDEYGATNTSTNTLWTPVSPPFNGIDSEWECLTTNLVLSGGVGIYDDVNSSSNARVRFYAVANRLDSDGDGLSDGAEIFIHRTDPEDPDADGDGVGDGVEIAMGSNPLDMASFPAMTELDEALGLVNVAQLGYLGYLAGVTFSYDSSTNYAQRIQQLRDMLEGLAGSFLDLDVNTGGVLADRPDVATWSLGAVLASTGNSSGQWLGGLASTAQVEEIGAVLGKLSRLVNEGSRQSGYAHQPVGLHTGVVQVGSAWNLGAGSPERWPTNQPIHTYLLLDTKVDIPFVGPGTVDDWIDVNGSARFPVNGYIYTNHVADISTVWEPIGTNTLELWDCGDCAGENNYAYLSPSTLVQVLEVPVLKVKFKTYPDSVPGPDKPHVLNMDTRQNEESHYAPFKNCVSHVWSSQSLDMAQYLDGYDDPDMRQLFHDVLKWRVDGGAWQDDHELNLGNIPGTHKMSRFNIEVSLRGGTHVSDRLIVTVVPDATLQAFTTWYDAEVDDMEWLAELPALYSSIIANANGNPVFPEPEGCNFWRYVDHCDNFYHPGAFFEMRSRATSGGHAHQAAYYEGSNGVAVLIRGGISAGTADRASAVYLGGPWNPNPHLDADVRPFLWAAQLDGNPVEATFTWTGLTERILQEGAYLAQYLEVRPVIANEDPELESGNCPEGDE
jgi:hypothetical protein